MKVMGTVLLGVGGALVCSILKGQRPEMRMAVAMACGLGILYLSMDSISEGVGTLRSLVEEAGLSGETTRVLLQATGIALIAEFGGQLCRDADESALAGRVELAGRAALLGLSAPLVAAVVRQLRGILP